MSFPFPQSNQSLLSILGHDEPGDGGQSPSDQRRWALRERMERRQSALEADRQSWVPHWRELAQFTLPRRVAFLNKSKNANDGSKANTSILNNTATKCARTLAAGKTSGLTSPARPWFRLTVADQEVAELRAVREWLDAVERSMYAVFTQSNFYTAIPRVYLEAGIFGTGVMLMEEDDEDVIYCRGLTVGEYYLATDSKNRVNTLYRRIQYTAVEMKEKFGELRLSAGVRRALTESPAQHFTVIHAIEPNANYIEGSPIPVEMPYISAWYEESSKEHAFLRLSGFRSNPILCARWDVTGHDTYGSDCPGMDSLGDNKALQLLERRTDQAIDKEGNPPLVGPTSLKNERISLLPGDVTFTDVTQGNQKLEPIYQIAPRIEGYIFKIERNERRISESYFRDLFLMLAQSDRRQITAREVQERHEEKLVMLGPVLERYISDFLNPLIDRAFIIMLNHPSQMIPPAPPELQGVDLKVEYISILAQAQHAIGAAAIERMWGTAAAIAQHKPTVLDKLDEDQTMDELASMYGVPQRIVRADSVVKTIREERAKQMAAQQRQVEAREAAETLKTASEISSQGGGVNPNDAQAAIARAVTGAG